MDISKIIGTPIVVGNLEIAENNFPIKMNWQDAQDACKNLEGNWRLPTIEEAKKFNNINIIKNISNWFYWSGDDFSEKIAHHYFGTKINGNSLSPKLNEFHVRAVRNI